MKQTALYTAAVIFVLVSPGHELINLMSNGAQNR